MNRKKRAEIAQETLKILDRGYYKNSLGEKIFIGNSLKNAIDNTRLYKPEDFYHLLSKNHQRPAKKTLFSVRNITSLKACRDLLDSGLKKIFCLNFASAKNPGGGFLGGSQAQEESLARSSGMYPCLLAKKEMYDINRECRSSLYTDHMIFSPDVPVFRDDNDCLLDNYYHIGILTSPAVNRGAVEKNEHHNRKKIEPVMMARIEKLLLVAITNGYDNLVLGAWGCGVFRNNPEDIATYFAHHLLNGSYRNVFNNVVFAVLSDSDKKVSAFTKLFQIDLGNSSA